MTTFSIYGITQGLPHALSGDGGLISAHSTGHDDDTVPHGPADPPGNPVLSVRSERSAPSGAASFTWSRLRPEITQPHDG
jgi:hypothetical protein